MISKYYFAFIQILCKLYCKENISKSFYVKEVCITKNMFENKVQIEFILWILTDYFKIYFYFGLCKSSPFDQIYKVLCNNKFCLENLFLTIFKCCFEF
jgi:hypothetical protein